MICLDMQGQGRDKQMEIEAIAKAGGQKAIKKAQKGDHSLFPFLSPPLPSLPPFPPFALTLSSGISGILPPDDKDKDKAGGGKKKKKEPVVYEELSRLRVPTKPCLGEHPTTHPTPPPHPPTAPSRC